MAAKKKAVKEKVTKKAPSAKRSYLKQSDVPQSSLDDALRIPKAILEHYAGEPTSPFNVAKAIDLDPKGSQIRALSGAAIAFGLTTGGAQSTTISITDLARRILRPLEEGEEAAARKEALLRPRIFGEFLRKYDTHTFPRADIADNVLVDMGVPANKATEVRERIEQSATSMGFIEELKGKKYVHLDSVASPPTDGGSEEEQFEGSTEEDVEEENDQTPPAQTRPPVDDQRARRVFITHGKNKKFIEPIINCLTIV